MSSELPPAHEWLYLKNGKVVHAHSTFTGMRFVAECGVGAWATWYGTGSQNEYDKAANMVPCLKCLRKVGTNAAGKRKPRGVK